MIKEYLFKITKELYATVSSDNEEDAYEKVEEGSYIDNDEEVVDIELIDVYDEDVDAIIDEQRLMEDDFYDEIATRENIYGCFDDEE